MKGLLIGGPMVGEMVGPAAVQTHEQGALLGGEGGRDEHGSGRDAKDTLHECLLVYAYPSGDRMKG